MGTKLKIKLRLSRSSSRQQERKPRKSKVLISTFHVMCANVISLKDANKNPHHHIGDNGDLPLESEEDEVGYQPLSLFSSSVSYKMTDIII
jgi:hypothetical protein